MGINLSQPIPEVVGRTNERVYIEQEDGNVKVERKERKMVIQKRAVKQILSKSKICVSSRREVRTLTEDEKNLLKKRKSNSIESS